MPAPRELGWTVATAVAVAITIVTATVGAPYAAGPDGSPSPAPPVSGPVAQAPKTPSSTVRIVVTVIPPTKRAMVFWGKKKLGPIAQRQPLVIQRPRDSGPLDLVVRAEGCLPVQTRAYTFADNKLIVKVTPLDQKNTLLGYREEIPPEGSDAPNPDAGAP